MWAILLLLLVHIAYAEPVPGANTEGQVSQSAPSSLDDELASMSKELDGMDTPAEEAQEAPQAEAKPAQAEEKISQIPGADVPVKRYVDVEPGEQLALVQYNVAPQIISTDLATKLQFLTRQKSMERRLVQQQLQTAQPQECIAILAARKTQKRKAK